MKKLTLLQKLDEVLHHINAGTEFTVPLTFDSIYEDTVLPDVPHESCEQMVSAVSFLLNQDDLMLQVLSLI